METTLPNGTADSLDIGQDLAAAQGIEQLASAYPPEDLPRIKEQYTKLIHAFTEAMPSAYGIPKNNLAAAYAAILAGSYAAYTGQPFPDDKIKPLYRQMEQLMRGDPKISEASMKEKASMYQVWVGLGMAMLMGQTELAKNPNANPEQRAQLQKVGGDSLRALLHVEPERVRFTANGLEFG